MHYRALHSWDLDCAAARAVQTVLAAQVRTVGAPRRVRLVAGVDLALAGADGVGAVVILRYPELTPVEEVTVRAPLAWPYVPGLLSFRELPVLLQAWARIEHVPDLILVDGSGLIHPRRCGLACHLGLLLDRPTIGCAKGLLCGVAGELGPARGDAAPVVLAGERVGVALRTRAAVKPLYVSVGHGLSLAAAVRWTLACAGRYRLPEPVRRAHALAGAAARAAAQ